MESLNETLTKCSLWISPSITKFYLLPEVHLVIGHASHNLFRGGSSKTGIGLELTKQAYDIGAKVLVADLKTTPDFDTFAVGKDGILYVQSDVTNWADFSKIFDACETKWHDVPDAYGICAGLFDPPFSNFWQDPEQDEGYKQVDVNVNHPIKLTRLALRKSLSKGKRASICIIVCSYSIY